MIFEIVLMLLKNYLYKGLFLSQQRTTHLILTQIVIRKCLSNLNFYKYVFLIVRIPL